MKASHLSKPFIDLADLIDVYSKEIGFRKEHQKQAYVKNGFDGFYHYMQALCAHSIGRCVEEHKGCVIQFGPLQSTFDDSEHLRSIAELLQPFDVVLFFPTHHSNGDLAKHTFYTKENSPELTADEILARVNAEASDIILIGAMGVGKSTVAKLLASKLDLPQVSMDELRWKYYKEKDWREERQENIRDKEGFLRCLQVLETI